MSVLLGVALVAVGVAVALTGILRFSNPGWRESPFWREHRVLAFVMAPSPTVGPLGVSERFGGSLRLLGGAFILFLGIQVLAST
jgi:hypothetical protein